MSDNIFINAYVENALGTLHEQINLILTLKTQLKISQDSLAGKESVIQNLNNQISELQNIITQKDSQIETNAIDTNEYNRAIANASSWEQSYNQMAAKVSHMDTLTRQMTEMKNIIKQKNEEILKLKNDKSNKKKQHTVNKEINILSSNTENVSVIATGINDF